MARNSPELLQAALYDRVLRRIRDPELRKVAFPGLLLRRLTTDVISEVLAAPCNLDLAKVPAVTLMQKARREGQLFTADPSDADSLRHRQDVRSALLPTIDAAVPASTAREINERAVEYYETREGALDRVEELYHRLRLGQAKQEIERRWSDEAGRLLRNALDEFPSSMRQFVRGKLGAASITSPDAGLQASANASDDVTRNMSDHAGEHLNAARWQQLRLYGLKMLQSGQAEDELLALLKREEVDRLDGPVADVYAQMLVALGRQDELLAEAEDLLPQAFLSLEPETAASVFCVIAAVYEGRGFLERAADFFAFAEAVAIRGVADQHAFDERALLGILVGGIRIRRKLQVELEIRRRGVDAALALLVSLGSAIYERRVLARETAANWAK